jgi:putative transposase
MFAWVCLLMSFLFRLRNPKPTLTVKKYRRKPASGLPRNNAKPEWVSQRILRLKILMPQGTGVRKIAAAFNRAQAASALNSGNPNCRIHVSKTYVANILKNNQLAINQLRKGIRSRSPGISPINCTWGVDLTGKQDQAGQLHFIFGIMDHGSRKLLNLVVSSKFSEQLAKQLWQTAQQHGKPRSIRTDNESCFTSRTFGIALQAANIRHQHIDLHSPWQNGRIERLFGTLKQQLDQIQIQSAEHLQSLLDEFKHWYNTVRLHQHLAYQTPQEVWQQQKQPYSKKSIKQTTEDKPTWWTGWSGQLSGVQWQC